jgi:hypothetical protein
LCCLLIDTVSIISGVEKKTFTFLGQYIKCHDVDPRLAIPSQFQYKHEATTYESFFDQDYTTCRDPSVIRTVGSDVYDGWGWGRPVGHLLLNVCNNVCWYSPTPFFSFSLLRLILLGYQVWREVSDVVWHRSRSGLYIFPGLVCISQVIFLVHNLFR